MRSASKRISNHPLLRRIAGAFDRWWVRFTFFFLAILATRVPFLGAYGLDPDSWRILGAARTFADTGKFMCPRPPCHPVPIITHSLLGLHQVVLINGLNAVIGAVGIVAFVETLRHLKVKSAVTAGFALALIPIVYINSTNCMDYIWAFTFVLLATYLTVRAHPIPAGLFLALCTGCRFEYAAITGPMLMLTFVAADKGIGKRLLACVKLSVSAFLLFLVVFSPAIELYGFSKFVSKWGEKHVYTLDKFLELATLQIWGGIGVAVIVLLWLAFPVSWLASLKSKRLSKQFEPIHWGFLLYSLAIIIGYELAFKRLPLESGYLLPTATFSIAFLATALPKRVADVGFVLLMASPFWGYATIQEPPEEPARSFRSLLVEDVELHLVKTGPIFVNRALREENTDTILRAKKAVERILPKSGEKIAVVAGSWEPMLRIVWEPHPGKDVIFHYDLSKPELLQYKKEGVAVYYFSRGHYYTKLEYNIDLRKLGARRLQI